MYSSASKHPKIKNALDNSTTTLDQGDGCFVIVDTGDYADIIDFFNSIYKKFTNDFRFRFRGVIHRGIVNKHPNINKTGSTWIGDGLNETARFLNSEELKQLLNLNASVSFVYGISEKFFSQASSEMSFNKTDYKKYNFTVKQFTGKIYLYSKGIQNFPIKKKAIK